jgi:murein DD-endopeptidase MepM/ murein hydrolase activator NlpD
MGSDMRSDGPKASKHLANSGTLNGLHKTSPSGCRSTCVSAVVGPTALLSLLALCVAGALPQVLAGQSTPPSKPPSSKSTSPKLASSKRSGKSRIKKLTARIVKKPVRKPPPPPAEIPAVVESASVWRGCLESQDLPKLAATLGMDPTQLTAQLGEKGLFASQSGDCVAYVAATGGEAGVASVVFQHIEPSGESRTFAFHKGPDGIIATPGVCDCRELTSRALSLPAREFMESINSDSASISSSVRWQLNILTPQMIGGLSAKRPAEAESARLTSDADTDAINLSESPQRNELQQPEPEKSGASIDGYTVRVVVGRNGDDQPEHLQSVEVVEQASGKRVNGAWWLDRPDGPGVIIGMDGVAYERLLWESPVKYVRSSRGVGASETTYRKRVPAKKGSDKKTVVRTVKVPSYHKGVDMTAPKGTDVHAVGDAKVAFTGRKNGFGNLIILDHGRGYQTYYAHLSKITKGIKAGVGVTRGDVIGLVGSTGRSTAPHLHFETRKDAVYLNPFDETHQLGFWLLTADDQERLAMQLLSAAPLVADEDLSSRRQ